MRGPMATHTIDVLRRLRAEIPTGKLIVLWDGAAYHRAKMVWSAAAGLNITLLPLPSYSPDLMAVEPLWRWLREDVTYHHCHATAEDLIRRVAAFEARRQRRSLCRRRSPLGQGPARSRGGETTVLKVDGV